MNREDLAGIGKLLGMEILIAAGQEAKAIEVGKGVTVEALLGFFKAITMKQGITDHAGQAVTGGGEVTAIRQHSHDSASGMGHYSVDVKGADGSTKTHHFMLHHSVVAAAVKHPSNTGGVQVTRPAVPAPKPAGGQGGQPPVVGGQTAAPAPKPAGGQGGQPPVVGGQTAVPAPKPATLPAAPAPAPAPKPAPVASTPAAVPPASTVPAGTSKPAAIEPAGPKPTYKEQAGGSSGPKEGVLRQVLGAVKNAFSGKPPAEAPEGGPSHDELHGHAAMAAHLVNQGKYADAHREASAGIHKILTHAGEGNVHPAYKQHLADLQGVARSAINRMPNEDADQARKEAGAAHSYPHQEVQGHLDAAKQHLAAGRHQEAMQAAGDGIKAVLGHARKSGVKVDPERNPHYQALSDTYEKAHKEHEAAKVYPHKEVEAHLSRAWELGRNGRYTEAKKEAEIGQAKLRRYQQAHGGGNMGQQYSSHANSLQYVWEAAHRHEQGHDTGNFV